MRKYGFENEYGTTFDYGIRFLEFPSFDYGKEIIENKSIGGTVGTLTIHTGKYTDTIITNVIEFQSETLQDYEEDMLQIKEWLRKTKKVIYTDSEDRFYKVKRVDIDNEMRKYGIFGNLTVVFTCNPSVYYLDGLYPISFSEKLYNARSISEPIYLISGEGVCTLTVNDRSVRANVGQNLTIDTERMLSYRNDGTLQNTAITGNYEDLYLLPGENKISITDGFDLKIIPNWRCL